ncbi:replicase polyprotein 1ab [Rhizoctonia solani]|uniref:Replicase polyprotein 1ab n=1 Tax=Rhizoctonia solani TaxID=456999 RepID=A0A8H8SS31_9AGAM|nr:replicase polyprotein 1ab [Rhizoctonia solani]QRW15554.1 replicase polyprotein 1ab [Rhizoctonia solani]
MSIHKSRAVSARGEEGSLSQLTTLEAVMRKQLDACIKAKTSDEAKAVMNQVVVEVQTTTKSLEQLGKVNVDATATADIAVRVACIIEILIKMLLKLSRKFGADFVVGLCGEIDIVLKGLLVTIEGLFAGILVLVLKKIVDVKTSAIMQLDLTQCAKVLGLIG